MEVWKDFNSNYQVSNLGRVRNKETGEIKKEFIEENHCYVRLYFNSKHRDYAVHRLVAYCFLPFIPEQGLTYEDYDVHHIDEVPWHNVSSNLVYITKDEHKEFHSSNKSVQKKKCKAVVCSETGEVFHSIYAAAKFMSCNNTDRKILKNYQKGIQRSAYKGGTAYGYHWEFIQNI